ncbi:MAG: GAF domain-containing protein [Dehalococcoidia bacterium]|nr:GAF domain-containing protein [Dehalococcoidia bacterium]
MNNQIDSDEEMVEILIAEDSPTQAERLRYLLEQHRYRVVLANDGRQAIALLGAHRPALVISDIVMPGMSGYELCQWIKANENNGDIPVILLTSLSDPEDVIEGIACGADSFVTKPYSDAYLLSHVAETLDNRTGLPKDERQSVEVEIIVAGKQLSITAKPQQMITLLTSTYRAAVHRNYELVQAQNELSSLNERLEELVEERTAALTSENAERRRAEEALRQSNDFNNILLQTHPLRIDIVSKDGHVLFLSPPLQELLGEEALGARCWELYKDDGQQCPNCPLRLPIEVGKTNVIEASGILNGRDFEISYTGMIFQGEEAIMEVFFDITRRNQIETELRQRLTELEAVKRVSSALRTAQTLDEMLPDLLDETLKVLDAEAGSIWLYEANSESLSPTVSRGWFSRIDHLQLKSGEGISGMVFATGAAHLSREFLHDPLVHPTRHHQMPAGWGGACAPIRSAQANIGVLFVSVQLPRELTTGEVRLITMLTDIAGNAIQRTRLHTQTEQRLRQVQALHTIDTAITSRSDLPETLAIFLQQALTSLHVDALSVLLLNSYTGMLEYAAGRGFHTRGIEGSRLRLGAGYAGRAALEKRTVHLADLRAAGDSYERAGLLAGENFASYYGVPLIAKGEVKGVLDIFHRSPLDGDGEWLDLLETMAAQAAIAIDNAALYSGLQCANTELAAAYDMTIQGWARALDLRDKETEGHSTRVATMTVEMARAMGIGNEDIKHVRWGAQLHDIGKMGIPDTILLKPGPLTDAEWVVMRKHPVFAHEMLAGIEYLQLSLDIPYNHHEKWDGSGYPRGLKGEEIPLVARIFAVVDVYDALTSDRPYRAAWSKDKALEHIREQSGKHFDPKVVEVFWQVALPELKQT